MPSTWETMESDDYQEFESIAESEGEDPAKLLHLEIDPDGEYAPGSNGQLMMSLIARLKPLSLVRAYGAVERQLHDGGRDAVLEALDEREQELVAANGGSD